MMAQRTTRARGNLKTRYLQQTRVSRIFQRVNTLTLLQYTVRLRGSRVSLFIILCLLSHLSTVQPLREYAASWNDWW